MADVVRLQLAVGEIPNLHTSDQDNTTGYNRTMRKRGFLSQPACWEYLLILLNNRETSFGLFVFLSFPSIRTMGIIISLTKTLPIIIAGLVLRAQELRQSQFFSHWVERCVTSESIVLHSYLDHLVPAAGHYNGVAAVWGEPHTGHPL